MNFFTVGFVLSALSFNLGYVLTYALKLVGALFILGGYKELYYINKDIEKTKPFTIMLIISSAVGVAVTSLIQVGIIKNGAVNILSMLAGALSFAATLYTHYSILKIIVKDHTLVNDPSLLERSDKAWKKYALFAVITIVTDILYRILPQNDISAYVGVVQVIARFLMIIYIVVMGNALNKVRDDFNTMHPV